MILYKLLPLKINETSQVCNMYPLVHKYSVVTLDNLHSSDNGPKITKPLTVIVCLYSNKHQLHGCTVTFCFLILELYLFGIKFYLENGEDPDQL